MTNEELKQGHSLDEILATGAISTLFQPIVCLKKNTIYGFEALSRGPSDSPLHSPINLFDAASRHDRIAELDLLCRELAIEQFGRLNLPAKLFLNTIPAVLLQEDYEHGLTLKFLKKAKLSPNQVIIELTEQYPIDDYRLMRDATEHYRSMGFSIALDDLGAGYAGLRTWSELKPDFVKLDRHFIQNIHEDRTKFQFVKSMLDIAHGIGCKVISEGIEVREEYIANHELNIDFGQGYYFARPSNRPLKQINPTLFKQRNDNKLLFKKRSEPLVSNLLTSLTPVIEQDSAIEVSERFQRDITLDSLPVITTGNRPLGMISRNEFMTIFASRYGRDLHGRKPISDFLSTAPIIVDIAMPLKTLSTLITSKHSNDSRGMFIITEDEQYRGVGNIMDLLRQITELQITSARYANPLSGLPGNVPINEYIKMALEQKRDSTVCYVDLDNFKPYNDIYGYEKGDKVILETARILIDASDDETHFVGHLGGDDFIVIFENGDSEQRCQAIHDHFAQLHPSLYNTKHLLAQGIEAQDRHGNTRFFPLISLSIGMVKLRDFSTLKTEAELSKHATIAKSLAKKITGNSLYRLNPDDYIHAQAQEA